MTESRSRFTLDGLPEFRAGLAGIDAKVAKEFRTAERVIAREVARQARLFAVGEGPQQRHFANRIIGTADRAGAAVGLRGRDANGAFWGAMATTRAGWNAGWRNGVKTVRRRPHVFAGGGIRPQFPPWVGQNWRPGVLGEGPLAINPAIHHEMPEIERMYLEAIEAAAAKAFPHKG